jgi:hypothetical protein
MNDVHNVFESLEAVDGDQIETLGVVDLGDAMEETKHASPAPWTIDSALQWGWN